MNDMTAETEAPWPHHEYVVESSDTLRPPGEHLDVGSLAAGMRAAMDIDCGEIGVPDDRGSTEDANSNDGSPEHVAAKAEESAAPPVSAVDGGGPVDQDPPDRPVPIPGSPDDGEPSEVRRPASDGIEVSHTATTVTVVNRAHPNSELVSQAVDAAQGKEGLWYEVPLIAPTPGEKSRYVNDPEHPTLWARVVDTSQPELDLKSLAEEMRLANEARAVVESEPIQNLLREAGFSKLTLSELLAAREDSTGVRLEVRSFHGGRSVGTDEVELDFETPAVQGVLSQLAAALEANGIAAELDARGAQINGQELCVNRPELERLEIPDPVLYAGEVTRIRGIDNPGETWPLAPLPIMTDIDKVYHKAEPGTALVGRRQLTGEGPLLAANNPDCHVVVFWNPFTGEGVVASLDKNAPPEKNHALLMEVITRIPSMSVRGVFVRAIGRPDPRLPDSDPSQWHHAAMAFIEENTGIRQFSAVYHPADQVALHAHRGQLLAIHGGLLFHTYLPPRPQPGRPWA